MTICISVKVAEGLVLAADSAVMLQGTLHGSAGDTSGTPQSFEFANKVSQLKNYPIGVMSWGPGSIEDRSIQSLLMEFEFGYPNAESNEDFTVRGVADALLAFLRPRYDESYDSDGPRPAIGLLVGGYSSSEFFADVYECEISSSREWQIRRPNLPNGRPNFGADWFGMTELGVF